MEADAQVEAALALVAEADQEAENFQYLGPFASDEHTDQKSAKQMAACRALEYLYPDIYTEAERVYEELATAHLEKGPEPGPPKAGPVVHCGLQG